VKCQWQLVAPVIVIFGRDAFPNFTLIRPYVGAPKTFLKSSILPELTFMKFMEGYFYLTHPFREVP